MAVGNLAVNVTAQTAGFEAGMRRASGSVKQFKGSIGANGMLGLAIGSFAVEKTLAAFRASFVAMEASTKAMKGDFDGMWEVLQKLPLGFGQLIKEMREATTEFAKWYYSVDESFYEEQKQWKMKNVAEAEAIKLMQSGKRDAQKQMRDFDLSTWEKARRDADEEFIAKQTEIVKKFRTTDWGGGSIYKQGLGWTDREYDKVGRRAAEEEIAAWKQLASLKKQKADKDQFQQYWKPQIDSLLEIERGLFAAEADFMETLWEFATTEHEEDFKRADQFLEETRTEIEKTSAALEELNRLEAMGALASGVYDRKAMSLMSALAGSFFQGQGEFKQTRSYYVQPGYNMNTNRQVLLDMLRQLQSINAKTGQAGLGGTP